MHTSRPRLAIIALLAASLLAGCPDPSHPSGDRPDRADKFYRRAQTAYKEGDFDEARDSVQKALSIVPDDGEVRLLGAEVALSSLEYAEVLRLLKGVQGTEASRLRGRAYWYKGDLDAAADELENMLNDPEVKDEWAKATSKLARRGAGRTPFEIKGFLGAVEMVVVSPVAPYFVVPLEIDGESALAMIATGSGEVVVDSATRPEPSWISLRFDHLEVKDVPALPQDLSGISKEIGAPIKAMLGVNLLRHLNATFDFSGHQFVARSFVPPPPPRATRLDLHYARGGGMVVRSTFGAGEEGPKAALMVDTHRPFAVALDDAGWKKAGVDVTKLRAIPGDPEQKLREGTIPLMKLGAFDLRNRSGLYGINLGDLEKATAIDLDGIIGSGLLYLYRCTYADGGRVLWIEDDSEEMAALLSSPRAPVPAPAPAPSSVPSAPSAGPKAGPSAAPPGPLLPTPSPRAPGSPVNEREPPPVPKK